MSLDDSDLDKKLCRLDELRFEIDEKEQEIDKLRAKYEIINSISASGIADYIAESTSTSSPRPCVFPEIPKDGLRAELTSHLELSTVEYDYVYDISEVISDCTLSFPIRLRYDSDLRGDDLIVEPKNRVNTQDSWDVKVADESAAKISLAFGPPRENIITDDKTDVVTQ